MRDRHGCDCTNETVRDAPTAMFMTFELSCRGRRGQGQHHRIKERQVVRHEDQRAINRNVVETLDSHTTTSPTGRRNDNANNPDTSGRDDGLVEQCRTRPPAQNPTRPNRPNRSADLLKTSQSPDVPSVVVAHAAGKVRRGRADRQPRTRASRQTGQQRRRAPASSAEPAQRPPHPDRTQ